MPKCNMPRDDFVYIGHMLDTTRKILAKVQGKTREDFDKDEDLRLAIAHLIQIIGEAANRVSPQMRKDHPEIPWKQIVGMRHKIVHDYMEMDEDVVWEVATEDLGLLLNKLVCIMPSPI